MKKVNEKGFSAVILLIIVVFLGIIAAGAYVYKSKNKPASKQPSTSTQPAQKAETKPVAEAKKYFEVKELGVKFEQIAGLEDLYYYFKPGTSWVYFSINSLKNTDCAADKTSQLALSKYSQQDFDNDPNGEAIKSSSQKIGEFYYFTQSGQATCSEDEAVMEKIGNAKQLIVKSIKESLQTIN